MGVDESLISKIVRRILTVARPDKIILFGSAATGSMNRDSDIDLLVVEPEIHDRNAEYVRIRRSLRGMGYPFDIILISTKWFEDTKNVIGGIAYPANKHGKVVYEAA
ncbi:MAG: nucleotidyltransferase domain-containing protein [Phycisphaerae bacterium]|nr:nucleotidyltransferase domain-containing protein [Phycisphaerae bacterium]